MRVLETCLYVNDLEQAEAFYVGVLGFAVQGKVTGRHLFLYAEGAMLLLFDPAASAMVGRTPAHAGASGGHVCFEVQSAEQDVWQDKLERAGVSVTRYRWDDRGESLYFRDPSGNLLELAPARIWGLSQMH
ncbi:VOC family protein [Deinococcus peraridilitoris]|nr:VOC family protein [Deinococcus peraridilitoris]